MTDSTGIRSRGGSRGVIVLLLLASALVGLLLFREDRTDRPAPEPPSPVATGDPDLVGSRVGAGPERPAAESPLDRSRDLHGRVEDEAGRPVPGAEVVVTEYPRAALIGVRAGIRGESIRHGVEVTDEAGVFRVRLPPGRQVAVLVTAKGWAPLTLFPGYSGERLVLTLRRSSRLAVWVIRADGSPAATAWVRVWAGAGRTGGSYERDGETNGRGEIVFDDVPSWIRLSVSAQAVAPGAFVRKSITGPGPDGGEVTLRIRAGRELVGLVRDARTLTGIAGADVSPGRRWPRSARTREDGSFTLPGFTGGEGAELIVSADGYATRTVVTSPDRTTVVDLTPGLTVTGRIVGGSGEPIPGAEAAVTGHRFADERWIHTYGDALTDTSGRFTIPGIDPTFPLLIKVEAAGHGRREIDLESPVETQPVLDLGDIILSAGGTVSGRVVTVEGGAARRTSVWLAGPEGGSNATATFGRLASRLTDDLGRFVFPDLAAGKYQAYVRQAGGGRVTADVVLGAGEAKGDVVLTIAARWELRVAVRDERGESVTGVRVVCRTRRGDAIYVSTDADGIATVRGAGTPESVIAVGADDQGVVRVGREVLLSNRDRTSVTIHVEAAGRVAGVVIGPDRKPIPGAVVEGRRDGGRLDVAVADEAGRFSIPLPAHGTADLVFDGEVQHRLDTGGTMRSVVSLRGRRAGVRAGEPAVVIEAAPPKAGGELVVSVVSDRSAPVPGVRVVAEDRRGTELSAAVTGEDGRCRLAGLPRFEVRVGIARAGGPSVLSRYALADGREVEIPVPDEQLVVGRVEGATVQAGRVDLTEGAVRIGAATIGPDGRFSAFLDRRCSRLRLAARARRRDGEQYEGTAEGVRPGARDVTITLTRRR